METQSPIPGRAVAEFARGFYFKPEEIMTRPAHLQILNSHTARVIIYEGRYHQIKRMFHRIDGIRLKSLHREQIGSIELPQNLKPGEWRFLKETEITPLDSPRLPLPVPPE